METSPPDARLAAAEAISLIESGRTVRPFAEGGASRGKAESGVRICSGRNLRWRQNPRHDNTSANDATS